MCLAVIEIMNLIKNMNRVVQKRYDLLVNAK